MGVTGVGKSTTLAALAATGFAYHLLPDRRDLTDRLIISTMQVRLGQPIAAVRDRKQRFAYTRAYRELYPGGMAHALASLRIDPAALSAPLIFDGLRGANEVTHAADLLPSARFAVLEAPDVVRVARLMGRNDPFDQIGGQTGTRTACDGLDSFAALGVSEAAGMFTREEEEALLDMVRTQQVTADDLRNSLAIVLEEQRSYDPAATVAALRTVAPARTRVIDTARNTPTQVAAEILELLRGSNNRTLTIDN